MDNPFERLVALWKEKKALARQAKQKCFGDDADEAMRFYHKPHNFIFEPGYARGMLTNSLTVGAMPTFQVSVNKVFELVSIMLPFFYHRNPTRTVNPRKPALPPELLLSLIPPEQIQAMAMQGMDPAMLQQMQMADPMMQQQIMQQIMDPKRLAQMLPQTQIHQQDTIRSQLVEYYLNYTPNELDLKGEARQALVEAIIKGRGIVWPAVFEGPSGMMVGSFFDTVDRLLIDPDAERVRDAGWIMREGEASYWKLEQDHGLPSGYLKEYATGQSQEQRADKNADMTEKSTGQSTDTIRYWKIYSRIGPGGMLSGAADDDMTEALEELGQHVYLCIAEGVPWPLNVSPIFIQKLSDSEDGQAQLKQALQWPTPYYRDTAHPWPFAHLDFHIIPRSPWPMAHITPAMGYQIFLDWAYSFLMAKMRFTSRDFVVLPAGGDQDLKEQILNGPDLTVLQPTMSHREQLSDVVDFVQHRPMNKDIWDVLNAVQHEFERATGMSELMYGQSSRQMRSAEEANVKREMVNIRPDDMAQMVENWATLTARMEGIAARYHLEAPDVAPVFGEQSLLTDQFGTVPQASFTGLWMQLVKTDDIGRLIGEMEYRIEASSTRKPNPEKERQDIDESAQILFPQLMQVYQGTGDPTQANAWLKAWAKSRKMDVEEFLLPDLRQQMAMQAQAQAAQQAQQQGQPQGQPPPQGPPQ